MGETNMKKTIDWSEISQELEELITYFEDGFYNMTTEYIKKNDTSKSMANDASR